MTIAEFIDVERAAEMRHEFYKGQVWDRAASSFRHAIIVSNLAGELRTVLRSSGATVAACNLRVETPSGLVAYPDVIVHRKILCSATARRIHF